MSTSHSVGSDQHLLRLLGQWSICLDQLHFYNWRYGDHELLNRRSILY